MKKLIVVALLTLTTVAQAKFVNCPSVKNLEQVTKLTNNYDVTISFLRGIKVDGNTLSSSGDFLTMKSINKLPRRVTSFKVGEIILFGYDKTDQELYRIEADEISKISHLDIGTLKNFQGKNVMIICRAKPVLDVSFELNGEENSSQNEI
ncbi:MAG: hypothetical protein ACOYL6_08020 [Bacteriovoracaceae bacterium]